MDSVIDVIMHKKQDYGKNTRQQRKIEANLHNSLRQKERKWYFLLAWFVLQDKLFSYHSTQDKCFGKHDNIDLF